MSIHHEQKNPMKSQSLLTLFLLVLVTACAHTGVPTPVSTPNVPVIIKPSAPAKAPPTPTAPTKAPSAPIAVYIPQPSETPVTTIWDNTQVSCNGKPLYMWSSPGVYLYQQTTYSGDYYLAVEQQSRKEGPTTDQCPGTLERNLGDMLPEPPKAGISMRWSKACSGQAGIFRGNVSITVIGVEDKTTGWGTFQAVRVDTTQEYYAFTGTYDILTGLYETSEWYVCGYGLIRSTISHTGTYMGQNFQPQSKELVLSSFTPISTNESHVRYILVDIQLGNVADDYRANISDEETAEALRRWDVGIRVMNIGKFERKIVNGQWQIVYVGTENRANGMDVNLTSKPKQ
jgi:hypothetical protein